MIRIRLQVQTNGERLPRMRGDDPRERMIEDEVTSFAPHARG